MIRLPWSTRSTPLVDTRFDVRRDAGGRDPDQHSPTLRRYHRILWSKSLPDGRLVELDDSDPRVYLRWRGPDADLLLASDSAVPTFAAWDRMASVTAQVPDRVLRRFQRAACTIGARMVFPANRVDGRPTINGARGMHPAIRDRFDLTLECIRRHYAAESSPLAEPIARYTTFFDLFGDFDGYVRFFLLDDLVEQGVVRFLLPFDDFRGPALPVDRAAYLQYRDRSEDFVRARNRRIDTELGSRRTLAP
jgi:hypothetical protein